jgi:hypothetical protein
MAVPSNLVSTNETGVLESTLTVIGWLGPNHIFVGRMTENKLKISDTNGEAACIETPNETSLPVRHARVSVRWQRGQLNRPGENPQSATKFHRPRRPGREEMKKQRHRTPSG